MHLQENRSKSAGSKQCGTGSTSHNNTRHIMLLNLIKTNDIAPSGKQLGTTIDLLRDTGTDEEGNERDDLVLSGELDAADKTGRHYRLVKRYKLGPNSRGLATFRTDYQSWSGRKLRDQDLVAFDADTLVKNKRAVFVVKHKKDGKELVAVLDTLLPVPTPAPAATS
jgi:hypothetical protein